MILTCIRCQGIIEYVLVRWTKGDEIRDVWTKRAGDHAPGCPLNPAMQLELFTLEDAYFAYEKERTSP